MSVRWTTADLQPVSRWRNRHAKGMSITSVLTAATQRALLDAGLPMATDGFHSLVDLRRYRPESEQGFLAGNLAKSVRIDADPTDLRARSGMPPGRWSIGPPGAQHRHRFPDRSLDRRGHPTPSRPSRALEADHGPVAMTFRNSMPALPGLSELPWLPGRPASTSASDTRGPQSITVFAMRMREHMQVTAAFPESLIDPERLVQGSWQGIPVRIDELVDAPAPTDGYRALSDRGSMIRGMTTFTITPSTTYRLQESAEFGFGGRASERFDGVMRLAFCLDGYPSRSASNCGRTRPAPCTASSMGLAPTGSTRSAPRPPGCCPWTRTAAGIADVGVRDPVIGRLQEVGARPAPAAVLLPVRGGGVVGARPRGGRRSRWPRCGTSSPNGTGGCSNWPVGGWPRCRRPNNC